MCYRGRCNLRAGGQVNRCLKATTTTVSTDKYVYLIKTAVAKAVFELCFPASFWRKSWSQRASVSANHLYEVINPQFGSEICKWRNFEWNSVQELVNFIDKRWVWRMDRTMIQCAHKPIIRHTVHNYNRHTIEFQEVSHYETGTLNHGNKHSDDQVD